MQNTEKTHVVDPISDHTHTVIFLHGRDSTAVEFAEELFESQASDDRTLSQLFPNFKWVFPYSGLRNSTRFEMELSQWFDIWSVEEPEERKEIQLAGLKESIMFILDIIDREATIVPPKQIILGGISQGCATAIHALMQCDVQLNGFIGFVAGSHFEMKLKQSLRRQQMLALSRKSKVYLILNAATLIPQFRGNSTENQHHL